MTPKLISIFLLFRSFKDIRIKIHISEYFFLLYFYNFFIFTRFCVMQVNHKCSIIYIYHTHTRV